MATKDITAFSFSILRTRKAERALSDLVSKINQSEVELLFMTGNGIGDKFMIYCIPSDPATFGEFLRSAGIRYVKRFMGVRVTENNLKKVLSFAEKHALSGAEIRGFDFVKFSSGASFYYVKNAPVQS